MDLNSLRYPIGKYTKPDPITDQQISDFIRRIETLPARLKAAVSGLSENQLDTPYRPDGWTVRQVIHHVPDSHLNSFIRFKWTLTEDNPVIKAYFEDRWANLNDYKETPIEVSLSLLESLHKRWVILLKSLTKSDLQKTFIHPETNRQIKLDELIGLYAWHGDHHLAHIESLKKRMGW